MTQRRQPTWQTPARRDPLVAHPGRGAWSRRAHAVTALATFAVVLAACTAPMPRLEGGSTGFEEHSFEAVQAVVEEAAHSLGLQVREHRVEDGAGYLEAVSPSGAVARVRYDYAWKDVTYLTVVASRAYGNQLANQLLYTISSRLNDG